MKSVKIIGTGRFLPEKIVTNDDLAELVDTSDQWIRERTGIGSRRVVEGDTSTSDLAAKAIEAACADAGMDPSELDGIIVGTCSQDTIFPSTACWTQHRLGIKGMPAFDVMAGCSSFVYGLELAANWIVAGGAKRIAVCGAEVFSKILDWQDRRTCVLFGDGAGAIVLEAAESEGLASDRGIIAASLRSDGSHRDKLYVDGGPSTTQTVGHLRMEGREVFKHAVGMITDVVEDVLAKGGVTARELDWFVPHQANKRIIDASARKLGIAEEKVVITVDRHGNTSAASVPLALGAAVEDGRIRKGDLVLLEAMGGGFTWGAVLLRW